MRICVSKWPRLAVAPIFMLKTTVLLKSIADFATMNGIYAKYFTADCPARAAFEVAALPKGALIEVEVIAAKN